MEHKEALIHIPSRKHNTSRQDAPPHEHNASLRVLYEEHTIHIDDEYYYFLADGTKTVEGRLYDEKRKKIFPGDRLIIRKRDLDSTEIYFKVIGIHLFKDFEAMYEHFGAKLLPTLPFRAMDVYKEYFTKEEIEKFGVVGIEVRRE
jgi:ASC-1-like (ASCH) protein